MSRFKNLVFCATAALFLVAIAGTHATAQEVAKSITINRDSKIGDRTLPKGTYTIKFTDGKDGEMSFLRGKEEVLKVAFKVVKLNAPAPDTLVVYTAGQDGSFRIKRIELRGYQNALSLQ